MKNRALVLIAIIILCCGCEETNFEPETYNFRFEQLPGCQTLVYNNLEKAGADSCFNYSFFEKLVVEFCVSGNCCPDSNHFAVESKALGDTITISVRDTAANLCRCNCNYIILTEFQNLTGDNYFVKCTDKESGRVLYLKEVKRR
ncbi:hypothetical protein ACSSWA_06735 [Melioribacter sp. Ez-97]|uniref:hypothetical protein n=1 Tax=Melioribacter sp. Ez-97 TaxID=3423434 RepID=UPI003EDB1053